MKLEYVVDRIETDFIVLEIQNGKTINCPREIIPRVKEGDVISIKIDQNKTKKRRKKITNLLEQVFEKEEN
ncbi:MAG: DUF3006 domain-containing protein [Bacilli bacterium]|nr:DUF3006 domain-containing protein [Bacilli bacterium]